MNYIDNVIEQLGCIKESVKVNEKLSASDMAMLIEAMIILLQESKPRNITINNSICEPIFKKI